MSLDAQSSEEVIQNAKTPEHGIREVKIIEALQDIYGYKTRTAEFDQASVSDDVLRGGLDRIFTGLEEYSELILNVPISEMKDGGFHNGQMRADTLRNAIDEVKGARAASASLISIMPFISDMARGLEKHEYFDEYYGINADSMLGSLLYSRDLKNGTRNKKEDKWLNYAEKRRVSQEEYIMALEKRVIESAPRWEEEAKLARLQTEVNSQRS